MSRHQPEHGADSAESLAESLDPRDTSCDLCNRVIWDGSLRAETLAGTTLWRCGTCRERTAARYAAMTEAA
jgi:hypothetical protein